VKDMPPSISFYLKAVCCYSRIDILLYYENTVIESGLRPVFKGAKK
jgi:hypothetical protein